MTTRSIRALPVFFSIGAGAILTLSAVVRAAMQKRKKHAREQKAREEKAEERETKIPTAVEDNTAEEEGFEGNAVEQNAVEHNAVRQNAVEQYAEARQGPSREQTISYLQLQVRDLEMCLQQQHAEKLKIIDLFLQMKSALYGALAEKENVGRRMTQLINNEVAIIFNQMDIPQHTDVSPIEDLKDLIHKMHRDNLWLRDKLFANAG